MVFKTERNSLFGRRMDEQLKKLMEALKKQGACHIRLIGCEHHAGYVEIVLSFLVKVKDSGPQGFRRNKADQVLSRPEGLQELQPVS